MMLSLVACLAIGYVCGSLPWGLWIGSWFGGVDVRTRGSGNIGATNVYRLFGPRLGIPALILDMAKGAVPVALVPGLPIAQRFPGGADICALSVGAAAIGGHVWTMFAGGKGGKGVATLAGVLLALAPLAFMVFSAVFVLTVAFTRYISLGSMLGSVGFTLTLALAPGGLSSPLFFFGLAVTAVVIARHRANLRRLVRGEETRWSFKGGASR